MQTALLHTHSVLRYLILILLTIVIIVSLLGWMNKKPFSTLNNKLSLYLFASAHLQLLLGIILYFTSDLVQFNQMTIKNKEMRYWAVEHISMMLVAVVLITLARVTIKKMNEDAAKHKRLFIFNTLALGVIVVTILMSGRGLL